MKVNFGNYTFFDGNSQDMGIYQGTDDAYKNKAFDNNHFNQLIANRQYLDAADYAAQFHFNDPRTQRQHENDIINLRRSGRVLGAIYGRIQDTDYLKQIEFFDNAFIDGGLELLNTRDSNSPDYNQFANEFIKAKNDLGNQLVSTGWYTEVDPNGRKAKGIKLTFFPGKQKAFGVDWLAADNDNTIEAFYENSGLNDQKLRNAGVEVIHKDGNTTLKFDKSNPLANKILFNVPMNRPSGFFTISNIPVSVTGYDDNGDINNGYNNLTSIQSLLEDARDAKEETFEQINAEFKDYSSTVGPIISDEISALKDALHSGQITDTQYNQQAKAIAPHIFSAINSLGSGNYEMYTNFYNDEITDETLVPAENIQRAELANLISSYAPKDIDVSAMVSNGKIGALITLEGTGNETEGEKNDGTRIQIFVPGLLQEEAQAKINRNTSTRAVQELNSMIDWGYDYKLRDGSSISVNPIGQFVKGDQVLDKESAIREINKDMIMEEALASLKYQYMNSDGQITDNLKYEQMARLLSMNAVQDIYGDIKLNINPQTTDVTITDKYGNVYKPDDIFDRKIDKNKTQYEVYDRLNEIYSMYIELMNDLDYYK